MRADRGWIEPCAQRARNPFCERPRIRVLHFSPLATFDLRLFANPGDIPELAVKHPWLRGTQVQLRFDNIFNSRPKVHDAAGNVPLSYQPDLLDPLGRTIMISFRKLFYPSPSWIRRQFQDRQQQGRPGD